MIETARLTKKTAAYPIFQNETIFTNTFSEIANFYA